MCRCPVGACDNLIALFQSIKNLFTLRFVQNAVEGAICRFRRSRFFYLRAGCIVPRQKSHLELLKVGLTSLEGRQTVQAQMRPLVVVIPHELFHVTDAQF